MIDRGNKMIKSTSDPKDSTSPLESPSVSAPPEKVQRLLDDIDTTIRDIKNLVLKKAQSKHVDIWVERLLNAKKFLVWTQNKYRIQFDSLQENVVQREIYHCKLGVNVGQEQSGERMVVVLQNDLGNRSSTHTVVAPITTHESSTIIQNANGEYSLQWQEEGETKQRKLYYYEIPVDVEEGRDGKKPNIRGVINISQIKTVSRKRLRSRKGKITSEMKTKIDIAIKRMLDIS